jgi:ribosome-associated protein
VVILDVRGLSSVTDYYLLATGNSSPHLKALAGEVQDAMEAEGRTCYRRAGKPESHWIVADYLDFVVHLFTPDTRAHYALEKLWNDARVID